MPNVLQEAIAITDYIVPYVFQTTNVPDSTGTANTVQATCTEYIMPFDGEIVSISARSNAAFTTGTVTFRPTIDGTAKTGCTVALSSSAQGNYTNKPAGTISFTAGKRLGVDWTKSGTVDPTTNDVTITVHVLHRGVGL